MSATRGAVSYDAHGTVTPLAPPVHVLDVIA